MDDTNESISNDKGLNMKIIQFILKKSEELEKEHLLVSFLCTLYIVEQLSEYMKKSKVDTETKQILIKCLDKAEKTRPLFDKLDYNKLAVFCEGLFAAADKNDRTNKIDKRTLRMFFSCKIFYEILNHFRTLNEEEKKKLIYAKYKTVYIQKCFENNIEPKPGSPVRETKEESSSDSEKIDKSNVNEIEMPRIYDNIWNDDYNTYKIEQNNFTKDQYEITPSSNKISDKQIDFTLSLKHAQYAVNALMFEDLKTATHELKTALSYLGE
ncbi:vacuolar protein sorting-associated protein VTA1, putative [Hepatocystis sp. ex Piliocolobus tephrosceles]|nr:vacuolar protein sorting-associated protein VTA1, putative [Hepatocystis sp. ex Piliocolobus tephrosceles]VWU51322.1 vacuolar protein sorting-associated protein VTA1, putative [Hepatocystis sp. ex Piliocolobus tephrosceles]